MKRLIGRSCDDTTVKDDIQHFPFKVLKEGDRIKIQVEHHGEQKKFLPEEISSFVLSHMKQIAESHLQTEVRDAVITVPAYFNNTQRQATKDAGEIAGFNVTRIINEQTAAAIAYAYGNMSGMTDTKNVLVFDLGGGTFDVSLLSMKQDDESEIEVLAVDGDTHLGGADFTNKLVAYMQHLVQSKHVKDITQNKRATRRLYNACEKAKLRLSSHGEANTELDELVPGVDFCATITREKFEELCQNLFVKVREPLENVLREAKLSKAAVDEVILVGGSTRIPMIQEIVSRFFDNKNLNKSINPDEAVAYGATLRAAILNGDTDLDMVLMDVIPMSLGWKARDGAMVTVLKKNTKIPSQCTHLSGAEVTRSSKMNLNVYEGERLLADENTHLGRLEVETREGEKTQFQIHFEVDTNGILTASIQDQLTSNIAAKEMQRSSTSLSKKDVERLGQEAKKHKKDDEKEIERLVQKNKLLSLCTNICYILRTDEKLSNLSKKEKEKVEKKCQVTVEWTNSNLEAARVEFLEKAEELMRFWDGVSSEVRASPVLEGRFIHTLLTYDKQQS